ncbi:hypothetical protein crov513 [Cafeteria roenbergensis virus]|uniref:Uncharacterized protein n=1 Tax=Cafeteria roenbergensis virus (strain BV-PW1) TaxID=693272 RepID=E3T5T4_CROVB|nr:hypothetical protein crov513 [Cafeteria roenbergensis virus BV-PW1]ADO67547.1 hypothetical protein crov513 [Cafeteria roenbergensis virus BV-PW1]
MTFHGRFNQPINNVKWPKSLTALSFGNNFNQPLDFLPESLKELTLNSTYNHDLSNLPSGINRIQLNYHNSYRHKVPTHLKNKLYPINELYKK